MGKTFTKIAIGAAIIGLAVATGGVSLAPTVSLSSGALATATLTAGTALSTTALGSTLLIAGGGMILGSAAEAVQGKPAASSAQVSRTAPSINPGEYRKTVYGRTAFPYDIRYYEFNGPAQDICDQVVCFAAHKIESVDEIWIGPELAWTSTGGAQGRFVGYFAADIFLEGGPGVGDTLEQNVWTSASHRLTGCAWGHFRFHLSGLTKKTDGPFAGSMPSKVTIIGRGMPLYDPRRDSTQPGGSGPMRVDDQSTWRFTTDDGAVIGDDPALQALNRMLGWRIQNPATGEWKLSVGAGMPPKRIDLPSFGVGASLCEEMVAIAAGGTEKRYRSAGVVSEADDVGQSLTTILAGCCGRVRDDAGKQSLWIAHNDLALAAADDGLNDDDVISAATWISDGKLEETPNLVTGKYTNATSNALYQLLPLNEVRLASVDGIDRPMAVDLPMVESTSQGRRVLSQTLARRQYSGRSFSATFDMRARKYRVGSLVPLTYAPESFTRKLFRVREITPSLAGCAMVLEVEHPDIYLFEDTDAGAVQAAEPTVYDHKNNPLIAAVDEAATTSYWSRTSDDDGTKPEPNATYGAPGSSPVGNNTADGVLSAIAAAHASITGLQTDIADLEATYGSTASAAASAAAADAFRQAAQAARDTASSLASAASGSASAASGSANLASTKAGEAGDSATAAHASEIAASGSSSASAGSASAAQGAAASASASAAAAQQSASLAAAVGSGSLNANPYFDAWSNPAGPPDSWVWWDASFGINRVGGHSGHPYSANFNVTDAVHNSGIVYPTFPNGFGAFQIEIEGEATDWQGVGILAYFLKTDSSIVEACVLHCATDPDTSGYTSRDGGGGAYTRTWSKYYKTNINGEIQRAQIYAMANWEGFSGGRAAKSVTIRKASIRPASSSESAVYAKASIDQLNSVAASAESARASTQSYLQGQINNNKASADNSISTLVTQQASAASSISSLSASVGSLSSSISVNSGAIASLQGRTGAFFQVTGTAGGNRAQLTVFADINGGAGVDLVGDLTLTGNAKILGIVRAEAFVTDDGVDLAALKPGMLAYKVAGSDGGNDRYINAGDNLGPIAAANGGVLYGHEIDINIRGYFGGGSGGAEPNTFRVYVDLYANGGGGWAYVGNVTALSTNGGDGVYFDQRFTLTAPYFSPYNYNQFGIFLHGDHASGHVYNFDWSAKIAAYK